MRAYAIALFMPTFILAAATAETGEFLPSIENTNEPSEWLCVGPFEAGARERGVDFLLEHGGETGIEPREGMEHSSIMATGGKVAWFKAAREGDQVALKYPGVNWDLLAGPYGYAGVVQAGYAYAEIDVPRRCAAMACAEKVGGFRINGRPYQGNPYGGKTFLTPVLLDAGRNRILLGLGGFGDPTFSFALLPAGGALVVNRDDIEKPDVGAGAALSSWLAVPVLNATDRPIHDVLVRAGGIAGVPERTARIRSLPPFGAVKQPIALEIDASASAGKTQLEIPIAVEADGIRHESSAVLDVRQPGEARRVVFLSPDDGSAQHYSIMEPSGFDPSKRYGLILSLHGAGVDSLGLVRSYTAKDWAFVAAPTNRRPFGFDWQDWGRLNALATLDEIDRTFPIDPSRVYLTGHSMGGHGTWHIGLLHPDLFAAISPSAGWSDFYFYSPRFLRRSALYAHPTLNAVQDMALLEDRVPLFAANARDLPVFVLQGGADDNVPATQARRMVGILKDAGADPVYREVDGMGHWWDDDESADNGTACVDYADMIGFFKAHARRPPRRSFVRTVNPDQNGRTALFEVLALTVPYHWAEAEAETGPDTTWRLETRNVEAIRLTPPSPAPGRLRVVWNGVSLPPRKNAPPLYLRWAGKGPKWEQEPDPGLRKRPGLYGPLKAAFARPFLFVVGTAADADLNLEIARNAAMRWWIRGNGRVDIVSDQAVTDDDMVRFNLILFGGEHANLVTRRVGPSLPVRVREGAVSVGGATFARPGLAAAVVYPNPLAPKRLIALFAGADRDGMAIASFAEPMHSGAGIPDFVVWGQGIKRQAWGGVLAAGFFDNAWKLEPRLMYIEE